MLTLNILPIVSIIKFPRSADRNHNLVELHLRWLVTLDYIDIADTFVKLPITLLTFIRTYVGEADSRTTNLYD